MTRHDANPSVPAAAFPFIEIEGDARARGLAYGRAAQTRIARSLEIYQEIFADYGLTWDAALDRAGSFVSQLRGYDSAQTDELTAAAEGAGVRVAEVMIVNARTDIMYGIPAARDVKEDGCTGAIVMGPQTETGHILHGQNWDWRDTCKDTVVIVATHPDEGPASLNLMEAGALTRCGFNADGIALTANFLRCDHDPGQGGVPTPFIRRKVLSQKGLAAAAEAMIKAPRSFSNNIMLSDRRGLAVNLETTPKEYYWIKPTDGLLVHANHFTSPSGRTRVFDTGLAVTPDSLYREDRVRDHLAALPSKVTVQTMLDAFSDDLGDPASVNRPPHVGPGGDGVATVASIVMDTTRLEMTVVPTPYANKAQTTYQLKT